MRGHVRLENESTWNLCLALRERIETLPEQGRRQQCLNCLDSLVTAAGSWMLVSKGAHPKEQAHE